MEFFGKVFKAKQRKKLRYAEVFGTPQGKQVLEELATSNFVFQPTVTSSLDPYTMAYNEGRRAVVLAIMQTMETGLESYMTAMAEANTPKEDEYE